MGVVIITAAAGLAGYLIGYAMADRIAEHKLEEMRREMGLDDEKEVDEWDELFKGD